jgi:hypothetical protein
VGVLVSWRTPDNRWLVDQVIGEGVDYRIWEEGELIAELRGNLDVLAEWLRRFGVDLGDLEPLPEGVRPVRRVAVRGCVATRSGSTARRAR